MDSKLGKEGNEDMRELMDGEKVAHHWIEGLGKIEELLNCTLEDVTIKGMQPEENYFFYDFLLIIYI